MAELMFINNDLTDERLTKCSLAYNAVQNLATGNLQVICEPVHFVVFITDYTTTVVQM